LKLPFAHFSLTISSANSLANEKNVYVKIVLYICKGEKKGSPKRCREKIHTGGKIYLRGLEVEIQRGHMT
jgi:hypothetical protein